MTHLTGGNGNDTFFYRYDNAGNDYIQDFTIDDVANNDKIDLSTFLGYNSDTDDIYDFLNFTWGGS